jgi:hypothetical protein
MREQIILPTLPHITACTEEFRGGCIDCTTSAENARTAADVESSAGTSMHADSASPVSAHDT